MNFQVTEPNLAIEAKATEMPSIVMGSVCQETIINVVYALPNGVMRMSDSMEGLVETSTNLAIVKSENGKVRIMCLLRSSVDSAKEAVGEKMTSIAELAQAKSLYQGHIPGWKPNMIHQS